MSKKHLLWLCFALFVSAIPAVAKKEFVLFESENFALLTREGEKEAVAHLKKAEAVHEAFTQTLGLRMAPSMKVLLVNTEAREVAALGKICGLGANYTGLLLSTFEECSQVFTNGDFFERPQDVRTINSFIAVSLIRNAVQSPPPWLKSGLAVCMQSAEIRKDYVRVGIESRLHQSALLHAEEVIALRDLMQNPRYLVQEITPLDNLLINDTSDSAFASAMGIIHRQAEAKAWIFCYYCLLGSPEIYREKFQRFIKGISSGEEVTDKYFQSCFDMSFEEMDKRLQKAVTTLRFFGNKIPTSRSNAQSITQTSIPAEEIRILYQCAYYKAAALHGPRSEDASHMIQELDSFNFSNPYVASFAAITAYLADPNDRVLHEKLETKALELGAKYNFIFVRQIARLHSDIGETTDYQMPASTCERMRSFADQSLEMLPDDEAMKSQLLWIEAHSEQIRFPVVNRLQREVTNWKNNSDALLNLALIQFRCGDLENSAAILQILRASSYDSEAMQSLIQKIRAKTKKNGRSESSE